VSDGLKRLFAIAMLMLATMLLAPPAFAKQGPEAAPHILLEGETSPAFPQLELLVRQTEVLLLEELDGTDLDKRADLIELRDQLATIRGSARDLADAGTVRTRVLEAQIEALGAPPTDGEMEPTAIAQRREALDELLSVQLAPVLRAREAQWIADTLVNEIDAKVRASERQRILRYNGTPLVPGQWTEASRDIADLWRAARDRLDQAREEGSVDHVLARLGIPLIALLLLPFALARFQSFVTRRCERWNANEPSKAKSLAIVLFKDLVTALVFGIGLLIAMVLLVFLTLPFASNVSTNVIAGAILICTVIILLANWLGNSIFHSPYPSLRIIALKEAEARQAARIVIQLGFVLAVEVALGFIEDRASIGITLANLLSALIIFLGSWLAFRLARVLEDKSARLDGEPALEEGPAAIEYAGPIAKTIKVLVLASVMCSLAGYVVLAREVFTAVMLSAALIGIGVYIQCAIRLMLEILADAKLGTYRSFLHFVPVFTGLFLTIGAIPLLAMIWGYGAREVGDAIEMVRSGISFGDVTLSGGDIVSFALIFAIGWLVTRYVQRILRYAILPQFSLEVGATSAVVTIAGYIGLFIAALIAIAATGLDLTSLAFVAGALSVGLGFGLQSVVENFISGLILLVERPVREGDWIEVGGHSGTVQKISVRSTSLRTWDRHIIIIPNSELITGSVKNLSRAEGCGRVSVEIGVAYGTDLERVRDVLLDVVSGLDKALRYPEPFVTVNGFGDSAVEMKLFFFIADVTAGAGAMSDAKYAIAKRLEEEGIEIPFPQRDIYIKQVPAAGLEAGISGGASQS